MLHRFPFITHRLHTRVCIYTDRYRSAPRCFDLATGFLCLRLPYFSWAADGSATRFVSVDASLSPLYMYNNTLYTRPPQKYTSIVRLLYIVHGIRLWNAAAYVLYRIFPVNLYMYIYLPLENNFSWENTRCYILNIQTSVYILYTHLRTYTRSTSTYSIYNRFSEALR